MRAKRVRAEAGTVHRTAAVSRSDIRHGVCRTCARRRIIHHEDRICVRCAVEAGLVEALFRGVAA